MKEYESIIEYINLERKNPLGCGRLAPLIKIINNKEEIVKELLDRPENKHCSNLLCFLDYGLHSYLKLNSYYEDYDSETVYKAIIYVLETFRDLDEETKWSINGEEFIKLVNGGKENV